MRVPMTRRDRDGTMTDGTAAIVEHPSTGALYLTDFRDLDGRELELPPGSSFDIQLNEDDLT